MGGNSGTHEKRVVISHNRVHLASIYRKKQAPIAYPVFFGGKTWVQVASSSSARISSLFLLNVNVVLGANIFHTTSDFFDVSGFNNCLASLKCSLKLVVDQVSDILKKLGFVNLVLLPSVSHVSSLVVSDSSALDLVLDMILDKVLALPVSSLPEVDIVFSDFSSSSSKILTTKVCGLESKIVALEVSIHLVLAKLDSLDSGLGSFMIWKFAVYNVRGINVPAKQENVVQWHLSSSNMVFFVMETKLHSGVKSWIVNKFKGVQIFTSGLKKSYLSAGVAVIMNDSLSCHVSRVEEISDRIILLSVMVLGLYVGVLAGIRFNQTSKVNSLIAKAINSSTFMVLDEDFNENKSGRRIKRTIDYIFVSRNLASAVAGHAISSVSDFFNTNHKAVIVFIGLGGLLDGCLNSLCKQANKDHWKFNIKDANGIKWTKFRDCMASKLLLVESELSNVEAYNKIDVMWTILEKTMVDSADEIFLRHWFSEFQCSKNRHSSRFYELEMLAAKIIKKFSCGDAAGVDCLVKTWLTLDKAKACVFANLILSNKHSVFIFKHLSLVHKSYRKSKMYKSKLAEEASIRKATKKQIEKFCSDKSGMIKSILDQPFHKMVLDHLVMDNELVMEPTEIKSNMDKIMEG
ncbi:hypothetical protein G9A89_005802 [Geosiphon pyriformis]|nr:hypothetical protein G9A89_005802 [Geosiphon pyriformis]